MDVLFEFCSVVYATKHGCFVKSVRLLVPVLNQDLMSVCGDGVIWAFVLQYPTAHAMRDEIPF